MNVAQKLSQLRPFMTKSEIEAILGPEDTKITLENSPFCRNNGISLNVDVSGIESVAFGYGEKFPPDVAVLGVCIGMPVDEMHTALPGVALAKGETGEPNKYGFVGYQVLLDSKNVMGFVMVKEEKTSYLARGLMTEEDKAFCEKFYPREVWLKIPGRNLEREPSEASKVSAEMMKNLS